MDNFAIEVAQRIANIANNLNRVSKRKYRLHVELIPQRTLCARHDEYPIVVVFARVDDRHDIADTLRVGEEQFTICTWFLGYELRDSLPSAARYVIDVTKATSPDRITHKPTLGQLHALTLHYRLPGFVAGQQLN
ncbi:hypothetical protein A5780_08780 [Nocardia sp. 852002-20019_SCH5090214]|nr:hypothetical protein A5780_08780 [Nocardia sp. 852002-20019_SCH5090214]